jgi:toxin ParE1/3/4
MTRSFEFRLAANEELYEAASWYHRQRPDLADEFLAAVQEAAHLAAESPNRFPVVVKSARRIRVRRFPYSLYFIVERTRIVVFAVFHTSRSPLVWQRRL